MGWGILASPRGDYGECYVAFFCNTGDEAFGPLLSVRGSPEYVKDRFYAEWDNACEELFGHRIDPRSCNNREGYAMLYQVAYLTVVLSGLDPHYTREEYEEIFCVEVKE